MVSVQNHAWINIIGVPWKNHYRIKMQNASKWGFITQKKLLYGGRSYSRWMIEKDKKKVIVVYFRSEIKSTGWGKRETIVSILQSVTSWPSQNSIKYSQTSWSFANIFLLILFQPRSFGIFYILHKQPFKILLRVRVRVINWYIT